MQGTLIDLWCRKIPHASDQLNPCTTATEPVSLGTTTTEPTHCSYWSLCALKPCSTTREATEMRSSCTATESSPSWLQLEKAHVQHQRLSTAKIIKQIFFKKEGGNEFYKEWLPQRDEHPKKEHLECEHLPKLGTPVLWRRCSCCPLNGGKVWLSCLGPQLFHDLWRGWQAWNVSGSGKTGAFHCSGGWLKVMNKELRPWGISRKNPFWVQGQKGWQRTPLW